MARYLSCSWPIPPRDLARLSGHSVAFLSKAVYSSLSWSPFCSNVLLFSSVFSAPLLFNFSGVGQGGEDAARTRSRDGRATNVNSKKWHQAPWFFIVPRFLSSSRLGVTLKPFRTFSSCLRVFV
jgi:hypothetical protein